MLDKITAVIRTKVSFFIYIDTLQNVFNSIFSHFNGKDIQKNGLNMKGK